MYFSDKNNTNIDSEFNNDNILSKIIKLISKYKIIIIILLILVIGLIIFFTFSNKKVFNENITNYLILNGEENITIYQGADYVEPGFDAYNSKEEDLNHDVEIKSTLDTSKIGEYQITYTIGDVTKIRKITVIAKPEEYTYIYLKTINNSVNVYVKLNETYTEPGYQVFSSTGKNLTNEVKVTGTVDTSKKGNYKLIYSIVDSNGVTVSATRTVIVMDTEISLSLNTKDYTNKDVTINIGIADNYFDYLVLPDNTKVTKSIYEYKVSSNGKYTFKAYNKKGVTKETSIEVKNIDREAPTGSCSGSYEDGTSSITVNAKDNVGIGKYVINGKAYTNNKITINQELDKVTITIHDKAGNTKNISCTLEDKNKVIISDKSITFSYQYVSSGYTMPYALYTPSTDNGNKPIPLIIWLHGSGEVGVSEGSFKNRGLLKVLNNWSLDGFNAYVICPHLSGSGHAGNWASTKSKENLYNLIDKIITEKNIDTNKIILTGHSLGGIGVLYMAYQRPDFYSALVVMSGYNPGVDISTLKDIPTRGYSEYISFMNTTFKNTFGSENYYQLSTSHGNVPNMAMNMDENKDNKSDVVEWMLTQQKK